MNTPELITRESVEQDFERSAKCMGADGCRRGAEAFSNFVRLMNRETIESGTGRFTFIDESVSICPNYDQLLCQDRAEATE